MSDVPEIRFVVCKRCGCTVDIGLCSFTCPNDDVLIAERPAEDLEVRVYALVRVEAYEKTRTACTSDPPKT